MTSETTRPLERLRELHDAYAIAGTSPPTVALMAAALTSGSESVAAAVVAHVEADQAKTKEALAIAAIGRELSEDARAPTLWLAVDVEAVQPSSMQTHEQALRADGAVRVGYRFMRESPKTVSGSALAARVLFPERAASPQHVEAAARVLRDVWRSWVMPPSDARAALLAAAIERSATTRK